MMRVGLLAASGQLGGAEQFCRKFKLFKELRLTANCQFESFTPGNGLFQWSNRRFCTWPRTGADRIAGGSYNGHFSTSKSRGLSELDVKRTLNRGSRLAH